MHFLQKLLGYGFFGFFGVQRVFADNNSDPTSSDFTIPVQGFSPTGDTGGSGGKESLLQILGYVSDILLFIIPLLAGIALMIAGYFYIFSASSSERITLAKRILKYNLIAVLVAFFSFTLVKIVASFF